MLVAMLLRLWFFPGAFLAGGKGQMRSRAGDTIIRRKLGNGLKFSKYWLHRYNRCPPRGGVGVLRGRKNPPRAGGRSLEIATKAAVRADKSLEPPRAAEFCDGPSLEGLQNSVAEDPPESSTPAHGGIL